MSNFKITTPNAEIILFNFRYRLGAFFKEGDVDSNQAMKVNETILLSRSLISIDTEKNKSNPVGSFRFTLSPNHNWLSRIVVGSWVVIMMNNEGPIPKEDMWKANPKTLKMVGRIDSVRQMVDVNQETGARSTYYIVTGRDWGCLLDTVLYLDPLIIRSGLQSPELQNTLLVDLFINNVASKIVDDKNDTVLLTTSKVFRGLINLWGLHTTKVIIQSVNNPDINKAGLDVHSDPLDLPKELRKYLGLTSRISRAEEPNADHAYQYLHVLEGRLTNYDSNNKITYAGKDTTYDDPFFTILSPMNFFGKHSIWQLLIENSNQNINETYTDIRFVNNKPQFTIYKRMKPFMITAVADLKSGPAGSIFNDPTIAPCVSEFDHIKKYKIEKNDIININIGNNWGDRVNFIQVLFNHPLYKTIGVDKNTYSDSCIFDKDSIKRDGFNPMVVTSQDLPTATVGKKDTGVIVREMSTKITYWKYLLKEWFFDVHTTLNGSISCIGQNDYLEVGDNIVIDSSVFNSSNNTNQLNVSTQNNTILAQVESVSHNFKMMGDSRSFTTTIKFVRGIIADTNGKIIRKNKQSPKLDNDAAKLSPDSTINNNVISTKVP